MSKLEPHTVYGFADHEAVKLAITERLNSLNGNKDTLYAAIQEAVQALLEINDVIPVQSRHRHLVANALENFANGPRTKNAHSEPAAA